MAFEPENKLEELMLLAASQAEARPHFYRALMDTELLVPGELGEKMSIETMHKDGEMFHPAFTSETRLHEFSEKREPYFRMQGRQLFTVTRGASFVINPRSEIGKLLVPDEIEYWLERFRDEERGGGYVVGQPSERPKKLIKALCVLFTSRTQIKAAHLAYIAREGSRLPPHPLIGIVTDGDTARLARENFEAASAAMPTTPVDVMILDEKNPQRPLEKHLLSVAPFFRRMVDLTSN